MCEVRSLSKLNFKTETVFVKILLVFLVIKLNVLCKLKKNAKMLTMTAFKMNTIIRYF